MSHVTRTTVDLGDQPDLAVIYLGVRRRTLRGCEPVLDRERDRAGRCRRARRAPPTRHAVYSLTPPHGGMRQYWRDFDALERWARLLPRKQWGQVPARLLRHRPLARDLLPARRHRGDLRRHPGSAGTTRLRARTTGDRDPVLRSPTRTARRPRTRHPRSRTREKRPTNEAGLDHLPPIVLDFARSRSRRVLCLRMR